MVNYKRYLLKRLIQLAKNLRKQKYLKMTYRKKYAFVGIGSHSIENLYPVINYFRLPVKYIVTNSLRNASTIENGSYQPLGTNNIDEALADADVKGIFICTQPQHHFTLLKKSLQAGKYVFIEKPPCRNKAELQELIAIQEKSGAHCLVGLQKRYAPCYTLIKKKAKQVISYNFRFLTGMYPEGNRLYDLFIHPIDTVVFLFGAGELISAQYTKDKGTLFLQIRHAEVVGVIELSTDYSWCSPLEELSINTADGTYHTINLDKLTYERKPGSFLGIPREKIGAYTPQVDFLFERTGFLSNLQNNSIYSAGYFSEIENFIRLCESGKGKNHSSLQTLLPTYQLLWTIEKI